jgi:hypothetical protein
MAFIVKRDAIVIPAGIPVASTNNVRIIYTNVPNKEDTNYVYAKYTAVSVVDPTADPWKGPGIDGVGSCYVNNGSLYQIGVFAYGILMSPNTTLFDTNGPYGIFYPESANYGGFWVLMYTYWDTNDSYAWAWSRIVLNSSTNPDYIPTTGWKDVYDNPANVVITQV